PYKLYTSGTYANGGGGAYRKLFTEDNAVTTEVMLAQVCDGELAALGAANRYYNWTSYGRRCSMSRKFAKSYLNKDGSPYTEFNADGTYKSFKQETTDRDPRLNMTIRGWDYKRKNGAGNMEYTAAPFVGHSLTGYHFTKYVVDDESFDSNSYNVNDVPLMRYAEVLLNYAEAMAELGKMDNDIWAATIGALRKRAGITGGTTATGTLTTMPSGTPDPYIAAYYPGVTSPVILEIRRDRACELCLEGFRPDDLKRWRMGELFVNDPWEGIFFPAMNTALDINEDGVEDVYFYNAKKIPQTKYTNIGVSLLTSTSNPQSFTEVTGGYLFKYAIPGRDWPERQYLRPIPLTVMQKNPNLVQNPGWEGH
ncbi:MAG: RagB/SusD family nutrient uptake outer membrane protein, partial [Muribaculaceae bacterium]|nr:RagB/SusD family nutrient uptake outer membrane protein [Muribaculaceae bacterium]